MVGLIEFDVIAFVEPEEQGEANMWLDNKLELSPSEIKKQVSFSIKRNARILIAQSLGWSEAQSIRNESCKGFSGLRVVESKCTPGEGVLICFLHELDYENMNGCPVCTGVYKK